MNRRHEPIPAIGSWLGKVVSGRPWKTNISIINRWGMLKYAVLNRLESGGFNLKT